MAVETAAAPIQVSDAAWQAIEGGYDIQVHVAPDVIARRIDDLDLAKEFLAHKLKGFVLKSHYAPTYERAKVVTKASPGITAYGAITLNHSVGGLNPVALEIAGRSGNKIVWLPTVDAANETAGRSGRAHATSCHSGRKFSANFPQRAFRPPPITRARRRRQGHRRSAAVPGTDRQARHDSRHRPPGQEGDSRTGEDRQEEMGLKRVLVTHAEFPSQNMTAQEQVRSGRPGRDDRALLHHDVHEQSPLGRLFRQRPQGRPGARGPLDRSGPDD